MLGIVDTALNNLRVAKRLAPRRGATLGERFGRLDDRLVFVIGSPRSGTTFLAGAIGSLPGFVDLGEVAPVKASIPALAALPPGEAARRLRRILAVARRAGLVGSVRAVEQTPELAHLARALPLAYPEAQVVHIVRDGRDVVCSLLEKPWLRAEQGRVDDAGIPYGSYARFWVEPERREEFEHASDARRAAWVWRSYVTAARSGGADGDRDSLRGGDRRPHGRRCGAGAAARRSGRAVGRRARSVRTDRPSVGTKKTSMPSSWPRSKPKPGRCCASWGTSRSAPPGPGGPWRGAPAARSSGRGPRLRDRASASAPGAGAGVPSPFARRALPGRHVRRVPHAAP